LYKNEGLDVIFKLFKDLFVFAFILFSLLVMIKKKINISLHSNKLALLLLSFILIASVFTYFKSEGWFIVGGMRTFSFLFVALMGTWFIGKSNMNYLAYCVGVLLAIQMMTVIAELIYGLPFHGQVCLFSESLIFPARMTGTFVLPNSLGVFSVIALAFYHAFSKSRKYLGWLIVSAVVLVLVSGSATGILSILIFLSILSVSQYRGRYRSVIAGLLIGSISIVFFFLPALVGRDDLFDSIFSEKGRIGTLQNVISSNNVAENIFGKGLGYGTNIMLNVFERDSGDNLQAHGQFVYESDSTITQLLSQVGVIGMVLFYAILFVAMIRDRRASIFYIMIMITSSVMVIPELFPVNFLLGIALAHSFSLSREPDRRISW
jgi:hypothetical protein